MSSIPFLLPPLLFLLRIHPPGEGRRGFPNAICERTHCVHTAATTSPVQWARLLNAFDLASRVIQQPQVGGNVAVAGSEERYIYMSFPLLCAHR